MESSKITLDSNGDMTRYESIPLLPRIEPAKCRGRFFEGIWNDPLWIAERKLDGGRYMLYIDFDGKTPLYSRRDFPRMEKSANVPHFTSLAFPEGLCITSVGGATNLRGTILDGEVRLPNSEYLGETTGIMNMTPIHAIEAQGQLGPLHFVVFDLVYLLGVDFREYKYKHRREQLRTLIELINNPYIKLIDSWNTIEKEPIFNQVVNEGGEGVVLKHLNSRYGEEWVKRKKYTDVSVFITDFQRGQGKYVNTLGALILGVYDRNGKVYEIGKASGMTDDMRNKIWNNPKAYMHRVIDVRAQELSRHGRLREPRFLRFRDDLSVQDCTFFELERAMKMEQR